jgi:gas vesicle protein
MKFFRDRLGERYEAEMRKISLLRFLEGLFLGFSIGSFIGLLLAPKSGKDTLLDIKNTSVRLKSDVVEKGKSFIPSRKNKEIEEE